ncbi:MAG: Peptidase [Candidatus Saccharibacteria bacterium]|nr:Peptidase [Candidatus Saccharibacteria bacterium]
MSLKLKRGATGDTPKKPGTQKALRTAGILVAVVVIFFAGVGFGNGRLSLNGNTNGHQVVSSSLPDKLDYSSLNEVYQSLKDNYNGNLTQAQVIDGLKHGLAASAKDPYTVYFSAKEAKDFNDQLNNSFAGIGARLSQDDDKNLIVGEAIMGFPADKAGIKANDIITQINGTATGTLTLDDAIAKIRGPAGTKVTLQIVRDRSQTLNFTVTRQVITLPSVTSKTLDGNIGYIALGSFSPDTMSLTKAAAQKFVDAKVKGVVLDMRNDPGGLLDQAINVSSLWLPEGTRVLQEKRGTTVTQTYEARGGDILKGVPTVVLVNEGSASAAEITAGALHDNKAAHLIGTKTYGKGVVQQLINLSGGAELKVTVASWYRPNGENINKKGITPDDVVKISDADAKAKTDTQLQAAQAYLNK